MKAAELQGKSIAELAQLLIDTRVDLFKLRMQKASQQGVRSHLMVEHKQTIARIKTKMTQLNKANQGV